jgi:hypothetical protein
MPKALYRITETMALLSMSGPSSIVRRGGVTKIEAKNNRNGLPPPAPSGAAQRGKGYGSDLRKLADVSPRRMPTTALTGSNTEWAPPSFAVAAKR